MRKLLHHIIPLFCAISFSMIGCSQTAVSEGAAAAKTAYEDFVKALRSCGNHENSSELFDDVCDKDKIWNYLDTDTKLLFVNAYGALYRIDRIIEMYFDPIEHNYMREKTGTDILSNVPIKDYKDLYMYMFKPENLIFSKETDSGAAFAGAKVVDPAHVSIKSNCGIQVMMVHENDGWKTHALYDVANAALSVTENNEDAMREYAQDNLKDELDRRTKVRDYFLAQQQVKKLVQQGALEKLKTNNDNAQNKD